MADNRVTIRGIAPEVLSEARQIVRESDGWTMGQFVTAALQEFIESLPFEDDESDTSPYADGQTALFLDPTAEFMKSDRN